MSRSKKIIVVISMAAGLCCTAACKYEALTPEHQVPSGAVIEEKDLAVRTVKIWAAGRRNYAVDRSQVVGHKARRKLYGGQALRTSDVD